MFFFVELFHNFDDKKIESVFVIHQVQGPSQSQYVFAKSNRAHEQGRVRFRLNKRFQPSFTPACKIFAPTVFFEYTNQDHPDNYSNESLFNIFLLTKSLRAPPVV